MNIRFQPGAREALYAAVQEPVPPPHRPLPLHPQHRLARPDVARRLAQLQRPQTPPRPLHLRLPRGRPRRPHGD